MQICYSVKQLGKKHPVIDKDYLKIEPLSQPTTLALLLKAIVRQQVNVYNTKKEQPVVLSILSTKEINQASQQGKVDFGDSENTELAKETEAIETALQAFEDGLFAVFLDDEQIESLDSDLSFTETTVFSFIRLTFLAGSIW